MNVLLFLNFPQEGSTMPCPFSQFGCNGPGQAGTLCMFCKRVGPTPSSSGLPKPPSPPQFKSAMPPPVPAFKGAAIPPPVPPFKGGGQLKSVPLPVPVVKPKVNVPLPAPSALLATVGSATTGRTFVLYRGDDRPPGEIKVAGFELWGESQAIVSRMGGIANYIADMCKQRKNGKTVADFVRVAKDHARPTVSTATDQGCGGYDGAYIYKVEVGGLQEFDLDKTIMPAAFKVGAWPWDADGLKVYMENATLETSLMILIDIKLATGEHAFFTKVHPDRITAYKAKGVAGFVTMAGIKATPKKLW